MDLQGREDELFSEASGVGNRVQSERDWATHQAQAQAEKETALARVAVAQQFGLQEATAETWRVCRPTDPEAARAERYRLARREWATVNASLLLQFAASLLCPAASVVRWSCSRCAATGLRPDPQVVVADGGSFLALVGVHDVQKCAAAIYA